VSLDGTHVCPSCRLTQRKAKSCHRCATPALIPLSAVRFELEETVVELRPGARPITHRFDGWRGAAALVLTLAGVVGGIVVFARVAPTHGALLEHAWLLPVALVLATLVIAKFFPVLARRRRLSAARLAEPQQIAEAQTLSGTATRLGRDVEGHAEGQRALIHSLSLCPPKGHGIYVASLRSQDFLLLLDDERRVVVTGELFVPERLHRGDEATTVTLAGLPDTARARHWELRDGERVTLRGRLTQEASTALPAGYRSDGFVDTLRGSAGHPLVVTLAGKQSPTDG
jgi:hypothetical protein